MDEELKDKTGENQAEPSLLSKILGAIKLNILLIILIVAICVLGGAIVTRVKKPTYTATNVLTFTATSTATENPSITGNIDFMSLNFKSVIDFCGSDVVADRAEYYYVNFLSEKEANANLSVFEYVKAMGIYENVGAKLADDSSYDYETYFKDKVVSSNGYKAAYGDDQSHFEEYVDYLLGQNYNVSYGEFRYFMAAKKKNNALTITGYMSQFNTLNGVYYNPDSVATGRKHIQSSLVSTSVGEGAYLNFFTISYKDGNSQGARDKLAILDFAIGVEINSGFSDGEEYFNGIKIAINPSTDPSIASDTSNRRIIIISALIGIAAATIVVYLKQILDDTLKQKDDLERITGKPVVAYIADRKNEVA